VIWQTTGAAAQPPEREIEPVTNILVTGGAGYIGAHACKALAAAGYTPVTFDNLSTGHRHAVRWGPFEPGDILDRARLAAVLERYRPAAVVHFAAVAYVGESVADPAKYYRINAMGSLCLLEAMRDHGIRDMVFSSSCAVYGTPLSLPIFEDAPLRPINPYGRSKMIVEHMLQDFAAAYGLRSVALRYFNAAGDDPDCEAGEDHRPETRIIPLVLDAASGRSPHFTVFGTDYDTPDGTCIRDYVHVSDLASAHVLALRTLQRDPGARAVNLGLGRGHSVREVIGAAERATGLKVPVVNAPRRSGDPPRLISGSHAAQALLGWTPLWTDMDKIVASAWAWHRHLHRQRRGTAEGPTPPAAT
jgi:UDP-arabinose 4-epimerase